MTPQAALPLRVRSIESDPDGVVAEVERDYVEDEQALEEVQELEERAGPKCVQMGGKEYPIYSQIQVGFKLSSLTSRNARAKVTQLKNLFSNKQFHTF